MRPKFIRAAAAIVIMASSLAASVLVAPDADASSYFAGGPVFRGSSALSAYATTPTSVRASAYTQWPGEDCVQSGNHTMGTGPSAFNPGATVSICVTASVRVVSGYTQDADFTNVKLTFRDLNGNPIGTAPFNMTKGSAASSSTSGDTTIWYSSPVSAVLDDDPLNGLTGTARNGLFELYVELSVDRFSGTDYVATSRGTSSPAGENIGFGQGVLDTRGPGLMLGFSENRTSDALGATTRLGVLANDASQISASKSYAATRLYKSSWGTPATEVRDAIYAGKAVLWSNKPPTRTETDNLGGAHSVATWSKIADGTNDAMIDSILTTLYGWADGTSGHAKQVIWVAVEHEPHDAASDVKPACLTKSSGAAIWNDCHGSSTDYKNAWGRVHYRAEHLELNGYPGMRTRVLLAYCAVASNATPANGSGIIGSGDAMYPGSQYVSLLAHDVYNYYHYTPGGNGTNFNLTQTWKDPATMLGSSTSGVVTLARQQGKKLFIGELGSHPGCPGGGVTAEGCTGTETAGGSGSSKIQSRDAWFREIADWIRANDVTQNTLVGFVYYHQKPQSACPCAGDPKWNWQFTNTSPARAGTVGYQDGFINNTAYNGNNAAFYKGAPFIIIP